MQGDPGTVYTLRVGERDAFALLITREVLDCHSADDVIGALRMHAVPHRLRERRVRLTCLRAGGKIIVHAAGMSERHPHFRAALATGAETGAGIAPVC